MLTLASSLQERRGSVDDAFAAGGESRPVFFDISPPFRHLELSGNDDQGKVDGKPRTQENQKDEEGPHPKGVTILDCVHNLGPTFVGDDLKQRR